MQLLSEWAHQFNAGVLVVGRGSEAELCIGSQAATAYSSEEITGADLFTLLDKQICQSLLVFSSRRGGGFIPGNKPARHSLKQQSLTDAYYC